VFFIDKDVPSATAANNVFIVANERGRESVTSARGARLDVVKGERMAVLTDGQRMETQASDGSVKISEFKEYGTQIGNGSNLAAAEEMAARSTYTHELLPRTEPIYRAELGWRIGLPLAALNFVILGLAVASVNPRAGGSGSLMLAMTLGENWVASGKLSMPAMTALLHGGTLLLALLVLLARHKRWSPRDLWRRPCKPAALDEAKAVQ
jgi:lipopolysaccharide export system permease protein